MVVESAAAAPNIDWIVIVLPYQQYDSMHINHYQEQMNGKRHHITHF
ncbi:MAG TPA: hypothetical protein VFY41_07895 [Nitrososphaeraceae archaeon]|nr:hypothetical protein [Nitrososphaeraceae archaeon]